MHLEWLKTIIQEFFPNRQQQILVEVDNQAGIAVATAHSPTKRGIYIDVRYHHLQDAVKRNAIKLIHTLSAMLQADALKKPLVQQRFTNHCAKLCLAQPLSPYPRLSGHHKPRNPIWVEGNIRAS